MEYYGDKEVNKWAEQVFNHNFSLQKFNELKRSAAPVLLHDVWNAYLYGDNVVKVVYIKKRSTPQNKKDLPHTQEKARGSGEGLPPHRLENGKPDTATDTRFKSSLSRARARVFELAMCNEFRHFCTFTLNKEFKDRDNLTEFRKSLSMLFRNINRERSEDEKIKYLLIPERHKKGGWHIHGLLTGLSTEEGGDLVEFKLSDHIPKKLKKMIKKGETIYNFPRYADKFGYFTATQIKDMNACSVYLTKYITKDLGITLLEKGQHLFFASQGLKSREIVAKNCDDLPPFSDWDFENDYIKIKTVRVSQNMDT